MSGNPRAIIPIAENEWKISKRVHMNLQIRLFNHPKNTTSVKTINDDRT